MPAHRNFPWYLRGAMLAVVAVLAACDQEQPQGQQMPPPQVSVVTVQPERIPLYADLPGRVNSVRDAQVRARVTGIVEKISFTQGDDVKAGDTLFQIDPAPYQAALNQSTADLKRAEATLFSARSLAERYGPLVKANAVSRQEYDNAVGSAQQAQASVAAARAAVESARINLGYTTVTSPIDGRIGLPLVTEGALVAGSGEMTQLATVQQLDPVYVDITQSTTDLLRLRRALAEGRVEQVQSAAVSLVLEDGETYDQAGKLLFTGAQVDPTTGQVTLRAEFPNPQYLLLPGMYVRVRLEQAVNETALAVPQQSLQRTPDGGVSLMVVGADSKVVQRPVKTGNTVGNRTVIVEGLQAGEQVVAEGFQMIRSGAQVRAVPWQKAEPAAKPGAPAAADQQPQAQPAAKPAAQQ